MSGARSAGLIGVLRQIMDICPVCYIKICIFTSSMYLFIHAFIMNSRPENLHIKPAIVTSIRGGMPTFHLLPAT